MLYPQLNEHRETTSLDGIWDLRFQWQEANPEGWESGFSPERHVAVPASFNDLYTSYSERNHWGFVWYSREVRIPRAWRDRRIVLRFGAVAYSADVWFNGKHLGYHETGHTPFEFALQDLVQDGTNRIVVRVNTRLTPDCVPPGELNMPGSTIHMGGNKPPANFDFYPYGGLHRPVCLYTTAPSHLQRILVDTKLADASADVAFRIFAEGGGDQVRVTIEETGQTAVFPLAAGTTTAAFKITEPRLWGIGKPELYHAALELLENGQTVDSYRQRFGVREVKLEGGKFLLNGEPVYMQGFGRHEDFPIIGRGHCDAANVRDFELLSWIGANSFRTSHYPYSEEQLRLADERGILVISESPGVGIVPDIATEKTLATHCAAIREYMARDYNHPCVVMWCVANEPFSQQASARAYFEKVVAVARSMDSTRPITMVTCFGLEDTCLDLLDVVGVNAYPGWYGGGHPFDSSVHAWFADFLKQIHDRSGGLPIMVTEFGADSVAGFHALPSELWTEDYQSELLEHILEEIHKCPFVIGEHVWAMCDFRTGQNDRRALGNRKGAFTRDRQPKMVAHLLKKLWKK